MGWFNGRSAILFASVILFSNSMAASVVFADQKVDAALKKQSKINSKQAKLNAVQKTQISGLTGQFTNLNGVVAGLISALGGQASEGGRIQISVPAGPQGEKGQTGERGEKGDKGDKGDTGEAGAAGPAGRDGRDFESNSQSIQVAASSSQNCGFIDVTEQCAGPFGCTISMSFIRAVGTRRAYGDNYQMVYSQESGTVVSRVVSAIGGIRGAAEANRSVGGSTATQQVLAYDGIDNQSTLINSKVGCPASYNPLVSVENEEGQVFMVPAQTSTSSSPAFTNPFHLTLKTGVNFEGYLKVTAN